MIAQNLVAELALRSFEPMLVSYPVRSDVVAISYTSEY